MIPNWSANPPQWTSEEKKLLPSSTVEIPLSIDLQSFLEKSESFPLKFPVDTNRCKTLKNYTSDKTLERNINSAYPLIHENILHFYAQFLLHKRTHGNKIEKNVYKNMDLVEFIDRLMSKRAVAFFGKRDNYSLLTGKKGHSSWETIGTLQEKPPLTLQDHISYEEIKLSAFLSVSSFTHFVNKGDRKNFAVYDENRDSIQDEGIIIGIIGPRLVKTSVMDYQELILTEEQNCKKNGYGQGVSPSIQHLFANLYEEECLEYKEIVENRNKLPKNIQRYTTLKNGEILDNFVYYKRLLFSLDTLFFEANERARQENTTAYIHVVGFGLGLWKKSEVQNRIFMDTCAARIQDLGQKLNHVSDICFAWINHNACGRYKDGERIPIEGHPLQGIKVYLSKREPHEKLTGSDSDKLLVVSYAWDGNALPGNEYWWNKLGSSGDSAAASSTQITEIHNTFINPKVSGSNLKIIQCDGSVKNLNEFCEIMHQMERLKSTKREHSPSSSDSSSSST